MMTILLFFLTGRRIYGGCCDSQCGENMKWKCFICMKEETGTDFNKHYMEEHHGNSFKSSRDDSRQKRVGVREVRDGFKHEVVVASPEATRDGGDKEQDDQFPGESVVALW